MDPSGRMIPLETLSWLIEVLGPDVEVAEDPLPDTSHTNHRIRAGDREMLLRRFTDAELLANDSWYAPADEVSALEALRGVAVPVPELIAADVSASVCDVPTLLVSWLPGTPPGASIDRSAFASGLAAPLPVIHRAPLVPRHYEPFFVSDGKRLEDARAPSWARDPAVWERAFAVAAGPPPEAETVFTHRDYHHGNTLWEEDVLTGIVDWTTACSGPAGIDLSQMRINLAWDFDLELADEFLGAWMAVTDDASAYHPYWDVLDAVDWIADPPEHLPPPGALERYETFVARELAALGQ
jgi:aminoglycoside phosphotransferase (APT) family kinase protein